MLIHVDMFVRSIENSLKFYVDGLGFSIVDDFDVSGSLVRYASKGVHEAYRIVLLQIRFGSAMLELMEFIDGKNNDKSIFGHTVFTILVPSLEQQLRELCKKGIYPSSEVFTVFTKKIGTSRIVFFEDPDGNLVEFLEKC